MEPNIKPLFPQEAETFPVFGFSDVGLKTAAFPVSEQLFYQRFYIKSMKSKPKTSDLNLFSLETSDRNMDFSKKSLLIRNVFANRGVCWSISCRKHQALRSQQEFRAAIFKSNMAATRQGLSQSSHVKLHAFCRM
ncbi:hypothetical protein ILYODFUR_017332 [Ilyodon furcidens]|uniref:Uncharacterized protein n=1 Tax=Ilyodon furcidens TaxID=33524 RepID=A0ABV0T8Z1_9TELE